jgi:hypothetical protein
LKKLATFLGNHLSDEQARQLVTYCSLSNMQKSSAFEYMRNSAVYENNFNFFRKAQIGNWRDTFSDESAARVDKAAEDNLKYKGVFKDSV